MKVENKKVQVMNSQKKKSKGKKILQSILITFGIILVIVLVIGVLYLDNNLNYDKRLLKKVKKAGFEEKQVALEDGTIINYGEGPDNGPTLLLIHGQAVTWEDYASVLPMLSKCFHIYAVDCEGHGESSKNPDKYSAVAMGNDLIWFMKNVIGEEAIVSGHSSGGLLTAWLAANCPEYVKGIVLEDPPLFSTEPDRCQKTVVWIDAFKNIHDFLRQTEEDDYIIYYLKHSYWKGMFSGMWDGIINYAEKYRPKHQDKPLSIFYLPHSLNRIWESISPTYDLRFGETFYDCSWFKGYDQSETLSRINCPSVLIHASKIMKGNKGVLDKNGILVGAMDFPDAQRAHELINGNKLIEVTSGHDVHYDKPKEFVKIMKDFLEEIE